MSMGIFRHLPCNVYQSLHAWTVLVRWYTKTDTKHTSNPLHSQILEGNLEEQKGLSISRLIDTPWKNTNTLLNIQYTDFHTLGNSLTPIMLSKLLLTNPNRRINLQFCILISHLKAKKRMRGCVCSCCYILPYEVDSANHKPENQDIETKQKWRTKIDWRDDKKTHCFKAAHFLLTWWGNPLTMLISICISSTVKRVLYLTNSWTAFCWLF